MTAPAPTLLPIPQQMKLEGKTIRLPENARILADASLFFEAESTQSALTNCGLDWEILAASSADNIGLQLRIDTGITPAEAYHLKISEAGIRIHGADSAGVFYGVCTLRQLLLQYGKHLPALSIQDHPDFPARGVLLDISRDKIPTLETLFQLVDDLASWKINQFQLNLEHTFAFQAHEEVWAASGPLTGQDVLALDRFCRQRHVQLVPVQSSLGHMERWLKHERYRGLAECPDGYWSKFGTFNPPTTLDPLDPKSLELVYSLYDELLPHFSSRLFNAACDEPWELGQGKSKEAVEERGGRVYLEYILKLYEKLKASGRTMQFWGDIILDYPELVPELPKDVIVMEWGYEATHDFKGRCEHYARSGIPFYVCPGTSSWNTLVGRTDNAMGNLQSAAQNGLEQGAIGYLITDWGDYGHWQPLPASYLGFAYGAGLAWSFERNNEMDLTSVLDTIVFRDDAQIMGKLVYDLGNVYQMTGPPHINSQPLATLLRSGKEYTLEAMKRLETDMGADFRPDTLRAVIHEIDRIMEPLHDAIMQRDDADLIQEEFRQAADLLLHCANWLLLLQNAPDLSTRELLNQLDLLIPRQRAVWLARNRRGGLEDSLRRIEPLRDAYIEMIGSEVSAGTKTVDHEPVLHDEG